MQLLTLLTPLVLPVAVSATLDSCYGPSVNSTPSTDQRKAPWGSPSVHFSSLNGTTTTCCDSLDEIRNALDEIDDKLLDLLNRRAAYVREATRFKSTRAAVNAPSRNEAVLKQADQQAVHIGLPVTIAQAAMGAILNSSVAFEECIVSCILLEADDD
ncbi:unnamed protein product [Penicillium olsonii]|nr:unnamed protein product [Penicillium olsonii]